MDWQILVVIVFLALFGLMVSGLPIAFSLGLLGLMGLLIYWPQGLSTIGTQMWATFGSFPLIAVPLFILMGEVVAFSGFAADFYNVMEKWTGHLPGSLAVTTMVSCSAFAACTGSSTACTATVGEIALPEMQKRNYNLPLALGVIGGGGALGILIPPSIAMILYGTMSEQSIATLFVAGVIPGVILTVIFILYIMIRCSLNPSLAPKVARATWGERFASLWKVWGVLLLFSLVLITIYAGIATPTEAAGMGAIGSVILAFVYGAVTWTRMKSALLATIRLTAMIFLIIVGGMLFAKVLVLSGMAKELTNFFATLPVSRYVVLAGINLLFIILGCIVDPTSLIIIFTPFMVPIVANLGFSPIMFGVMFTINIEIANLTPPVGYNLFVLQSIAPEVPYGDIIKGVMPFVFMYILGIVLLMIFPQLALWLPGTMSK